MKKLIKEIKALIADKLIYWAFILDPNRFIEKKSRLDLDAMQKKLDEVLAKETNESIKEWICNLRERERKSNLHPMYHNIEKVMKLGDIGLPNDDYTIH